MKYFELVDLSAKKALSKLRASTCYLKRQYQYSSLAAIVLHCGHEPVDNHDGAWL
jgi:hypothetical protein